MLLRERPVRAQRGRVALERRAVRLPGRSRVRHRGAAAAAAAGHAVLAAVLGPTATATRRGARLFNNGFSVKYLASPYQTPLRNNGSFRLKIKYPFPLKLKD